MRRMYVFYLLMMSCLTTPAISETLTQKESIGLRLVEENCQSCHGLTGKATVESWPNLLCQNRGYMYSRLIYFLHNREQSSLMGEAVKDLTLADIDAVARYYADLDCGAIK